MYIAKPDVIRRGEVRYHFVSHNSSKDTMCLFFADMHTSTQQERLVYVDDVKKDETRVTLLLFLMHSIFMQLAPARTKNKPCEEQTATYVVSSTRSAYSFFHTPFCIVRGGSHTMPCFFVINTYIHNVSIRAQEYAIVPDQREKLKKFKLHLHRTFTLQPVERVPKPDSLKFDDNVELVSMLLFSRGKYNCNVSDLSEYGFCTDEKNGVYYHEVPQEGRKLSADEVSLSFLTFLYRLDSLSLQVYLLLHRLRILKLRQETFIWQHLWQEYEKAITNDVQLLSKARPSGVKRKSQGTTWPNEPLEKNIVIRVMTDYGNAGEYNTVMWYYPERQLQNNRGVFARVPDASGPFLNKKQLNNGVALSGPQQANKEKSYPIVDQPYATRYADLNELMKHYEHCHGQQPQSSLPQKQRLKATPAASGVTGTTVFGGRGTYAPPAVFQVCTPVCLYW